MDMFRFRQGFSSSGIQSAIIRGEEINIKYRDALHASPDRENEDE